MTQEFTAKKVLLQNSQGEYLIPYTEPCAWGEITGTLADQEDLQAALDEKTDVDKVDELIEEHNTDLSAHQDIRDAIQDNLIIRCPNAQMIGNPTVAGNIVTGFSTANYARLPFVFNPNNKYFEVGVCIKTGEDVETEQFIFCSEYGLLVELKDSHFVLKASSNGTSWNIGEVEGTLEVEAETFYYLRITWNGSKYVLSYSTELSEYETCLVKETATKEANIQYRILSSLGLSEDMVVLEDDTYVDDITITSTVCIHEAVSFLGGVNTLLGAAGKPFAGLINFEYTYIYVASQPLWEGMDACGLNSRANTSLSNLDSEGLKKITYTSGDYVNITNNVVSVVLDDLNITLLDGAVVV